ncbi:MAG: DEAD/DEAH box helicase family protein [Bacteroidaceae bacterium]|nr:DEAD/DEAH box helicase family protein [Bacteroidaceae bacterium]
MNESDTRLKKIDPKLREVGWTQVPESDILTEQNAYLIAPGKVSALPQNRHPKKADYVLQYRKQKLAVIEAKSDDLNVSEGVAQAKIYAEMLNIRFTYSCNGDKIWAIDMGVKDAQGNYIIPSKEGPADRFPSPQELWQMTFPETNPLRDKFNLCPLNRGGGREPRYYQEIAINKVMEAVAKGNKRILLTMATGTGKTYTAFQICWKLFNTNWNLRGDGQKPRILFISDRNILANQAKNDFDQFPSDAMERITPDSLHDKKHMGYVPKARNLYFTIFQTFMSEDSSGKPYYMQYLPDFFDFIIIDECHRGGANDESEWRQVMTYFESAVQLGMTATPRRKVNVNTYKYFGDPVYSYSLKQGIEDGYLTPYRVKIGTSNIDTYKYEPDDEIEHGEIDTNKTYDENDFYNGYIEIRERDEHRVKEMLGLIGPDEKTLVFCSTQLHAMIIRDMINQWKSVPDSNYCERVTADEGDKGETTLREFQNNDRKRPTILTTSQKLSTGVDARNVRNIVLMRPVNNIVEFKQIMGRGTRLFDGKYYFTLIDFVGASENFKDEEWDGDPFCPVCGNYPCTCNKKPHVCPKCGQHPCVCPPPPPPQPCPVCGNLPCTCPGSGGTAKKTVRVKLSPSRELLLQTHWEERIQYGDELLSLQEYIKRLFGTLPKFLKGEDDLRKQWSKPDSRQKLLQLLEESGFPEDKLEQTRSFLEMEQCDMLDVLSYLAYNTTPIERQRRAEILLKQTQQELTEEQQEFVDYLMRLYVRNGFHELGGDKLPTLINMKYHSAADALNLLQMTPEQIRTFYFGLQEKLYNLHLTINNNFNGPVGCVNNKV